MNTKLHDVIDVSVIIVNYNTLAMTSACIESVHEQTTQTSFEIILVDNASRDGSVEHFKQQAERIKFIELDENLGFARANNIASELATGRYILLLNSDTVVLDGAIDRLVAFANEHPDAGIWGGRTVFPDGSLNATSCWGRMTVWSLFCQLTGLRAAFPNSALLSSETYGGWKRDYSRPVDIVTGCFLLIDRALWKRLGGFGSNFFMYGEDADLCLRATASGARPMMTPSATIIHYGGMSENVRTRKEIQLLKAKLTTLEYQYRGVELWLSQILLRSLPLSRFLGYGLGALVTRGRRYAAKTEVWREVWQRRPEWWNGYGQETNNDDRGNSHHLAGSARS